MTFDLDIAGFKRFADQRFKFAQLTVLAGVNGTGKTSVIHALLLAYEACRRGDGIVELNGPFDLALGNIEDVANYDAGGQFKLGLIGGFGSIELTFRGKDGQRFAHVDGTTGEAAAAFAGLPRSFQYISADRLGPRLVQKSTALPPALLSVGARGEHTAQACQRRLTPRTVHRSVRPCRPPHTRSPPPAARSLGRCWSC